MTYWTAQQTVNWLAGFNGFYSGPATAYVNPFTTDLYGAPLKWHYCCTEAVTDAYLHAGLDLRPLLNKAYGFGSFSQCANHVAFYNTKQGRQYAVEVTPATATTGDQIIYWNGHRYYHTGLIAAPTTGDRLHTDEADTSSPLHPGSDSTGGVVRARDDRRVSDYLNPVRPGHYGARVFRPLWFSKPDPSPTPKPVTLPTLSLGSTGTIVKHLQTDLDHVFPSYAHLAVDGSYGYATRHAVQIFQSRTGLATDGVVGPLTWAQLAHYGVKPHA